MHTSINRHDQWLQMLDSNGRHQVTIALNNIFFIIININININVRKAVSPHTTRKAY